MARSYPIAASTEISSPYGQRWGQLHRGIDFACPVGTPIYAAADGVVVEGKDRPQGSVDGFGSWIWIDCQKSANVDLIYGHVKHSGILVKAGDIVKAGQLIGVSGDEWKGSPITGPHLHFEVWGPPGRLGGSSFDPAPWLRGANDPAAPKQNATEPAKDTQMAPKPTFNYYEKLCSSRSSRNGARVVYGLGHTQQGKGTALSLRDYLANTNNNASYHYTIDNTTCVAVVDTDYGSWSVLDANPQSINWCYAGSFAEWTRQQWIDNMRNGIRISAWILAQDLKKYPHIGKIVQGRPYSKGKVPCISDHYFVTKILKIGSHTDLGAGYPWDLFEADLKLYMGEPALPAPVANRINECAAEADNKWLGKRLAPAGATNETKTPDGEGRYVKFEGGYVYWHHRTGAFAVPNILFSQWGLLKYERGPLGYPAGKYDRLPGGHVQHFERGTLYLKDGAAQAHFVTGIIGARWAREGYENGPLGWPISNEYDFDGGKAQDFENGKLFWNPSGAVRELTTKDVKMELAA